MGAQVEHLASLLLATRPTLFSPSSCNASTEGNEGQSNEGHNDDTDCDIQIGSRDDRPEDEGCEGCSGGYDGCCGDIVEEVGLFQVGWQVELEAEEESRDAGPEGREPVHQGAVCLQS